MEPIATAIVGVSGFGRVHYQDLIDGAARGTLHPVAACVINQDEEAEKCAVLRELGVRLYDDLDRLLAAHGSELDLVQLPTGIPLHRPMCEAALAVGANVLVEKPLAGSTVDAVAIRDARDAAGRLVAVGFQRMFDPTTWALKEALLAGEIGTIEAITGYGRWARPRSYYQRNGWAGRLRLDDGAPVLDSPIQNAMAHYVMLALFLGGTELAAPAAVERLKAELYRCNQIESADTCAFRVSTAGGIPISFIATHACESNDGPVLRVRGSAGEAEWRFGGSVDPVRITPAGGPTRELVCLSGAELRPHLIDTLATAIRGEAGARICTVDQALVHTRVIDAVHRASAVEAIDPAHWHTAQPEDPVRVLSGFEACCDAQLSEGTLPSETGAAWAVAAGSADC